MKKIFVAIVLGALFACSLGFGNPAINGKHSGKKGKDGASVNCMYCHDAAKGAVPKAKGGDLAKLKAGPFCKIAGCHG
jgi:hypothetical protein